VQACATDGSQGCCCWCVAPPRSIVLGSCGWKISPFSLQFWALSATFSFSSLPWCACSLDSWRDEVPLRPPTFTTLLPFPEHSSCRRPPPPPSCIHRGGSLKLAHTWLNSWQLQHCVRPVWAFYDSTLIAIWQRFLIFNISWDSDVLGKVF
jgi:hypothetical protein